jgi:hypothetical protein
MKRFLSMTAAALFALSLVGAVQSQEPVAPGQPADRLADQRLAGGPTFPESLVGGWRLTITNLYGKKSCTIFFTSHGSYTVMGDEKGSGYYSTINGNSELNLSGTLHVFWGKVHPQNNDEFSIQDYGTTYQFERIR